MKLRLIHWQDEEGVRHGHLLRSLHHDVDDEPIDDAELQLMVSNPPDVVVIDITGFPARGRDIGVYLHQRAPDMPILFVGGKEWTVAGIKQAVPDAAFSEWALVAPTLENISEGD